MKTGNTYLFYDDIKGFSNHWAKAAREAIEEIDALIDPTARCIDVKVPLIDGGFSQIMPKSNVKLMKIKNFNMVFHEVEQIANSLLDYVSKSLSDKKFYGNDAFIYLPDTPMFKDQVLNDNISYPTLGGIGGRYELKAPHSSFYFALASPIAATGIEIPGMTSNQSEYELFKTLVAHEYLHIFDIPKKRSKNAIGEENNEYAHCSDPACTMTSGNIYVRTLARLERGYPVCDDCKRQIEDLRKTRRALVLYNNRRLDR
ncbi:MAG: hypothetical protein FWD15_02165 [Alphaproteobacteria bacterium]|nr:hypothetical protein [Alphaproteobacteria bacterium]